MAPHIYLYGSRGAASTGIVGEISLREISLSETSNTNSSSSHRFVANKVSHGSDSPPRSSCLGVDSLSQWEYWSGEASHLVLPRDQEEDLLPHLNLPLSAPFFQTDSPHTVCVPVLFPENAI